VLSEKPVPQTLKLMAAEATPLASTRHAKIKKSRSVTQFLSIRTATAS
jgi:hypothetical protein